MASYRSLSDTEPDDDQLLIEKLPGCPKSTGNKKRLPCVARVSLGVLLVFILTYAISRYVKFRNISRYLTNGELDEICARHTSRPSRFLDEVGIKWTTKDIDASVFHKNKYKQNPSDALDERWTALGGLVRETIIPPELAESMGLSKDKDWIRAKPEYGGGYLANIDGLHLLHCTNAIRQTLYWNYEHYRDKGVYIFTSNLGEPIDDIGMKYHIYHCLDMVRQQLMCNIDVGMVGYRWSNYSGGEPIPTPRFSPTKRCRNYDDLLEWAKKNQWTRTNSELMEKLQPPGELDFAHMSEAP